MKFDPNQHHRRSIRLHGYDYSSAGAYFVTICTYYRKCLFGEITDGKMRVNEYGQSVQEEWVRSAKIRCEIELDAFVIMPNHIHGIITIHDDVGAIGRSPLQKIIPSHGPAKQSLGAFVAGFKSATTKRINEIRNTPHLPVWQRNYYEHVIRDEKSLNQIREYILNNPLNWEMDRENPVNINERAVRQPPLHIKKRTPWEV